MEDLRRKLDALRAGGVAKASFHPDGELAAVEFPPGIVATYGDAPDTTQPSTDSAKAEESARLERQRISLASSGGPVRRLIDHR